MRFTVAKESFALRIPVSRDLYCLETFLIRILYFS